MPINVLSKEAGKELCPKVPNTIPAPSEKRQAKDAYCVSLTYDEIEEILTLAENTAEGYYLLYEKMEMLLNNPVAKDMWFLNVYVREDNYGGPEEGGWWYETKACLYSKGYTGDLADTASFVIMVEEFVQTCEGYGYDLLNDGSERTYESMVHDVMVKDRLYAAFNDGGLRMLVAIERGPGETHDTRRKHYE